LALSPEVVFPFATGVLLLPAAGFVYTVYRETGFRALLFLSLGLLAVAVQSFLDGYETMLLQSLGGGSWDNIPGDKLKTLLVIDAVRGILIVVWASMEVLFTAHLALVESRLIRVYLPAAILVAGTLETLYFNFSDIEPVSKRILISSAGRVLGILVPVALATGAYILWKLWREVRTKSLLAWGLGFILHGVTLPTYTLAKEAGSAALGLWYLFGGVVPAFLAAMGAYLLARESREAAAAG